jgi:hypothetical protein
MSNRELPDSVIEYHLKASTDLERARLRLSGRSLRIRVLVLILGIAKNV